MKGADLLGPQSYLPQKVNQLNLHRPLAAASTTLCPLLVVLNLPHQSASERNVGLCVPIISKPLSPDCHLWTLGTAHPESFPSKVGVYTVSKGQSARGSNLGLASSRFYDLEQSAGLL